MSTHNPILRRSRHLLTTHVPWTRARDQHETHVSALIRCTYHIRIASQYCCTQEKVMLAQSRPSLLASLEPLHPRNTRLTKSLMPYSSPRRPHHSAKVGAWVRRQQIFTREIEPLPRPGIPRSIALPRDTQQIACLLWLSGRLGARACSTSGASTNVAVSPDRACHGVTVPAMAPMLMMCTR